MSLKQDPTLETLTALAREENRISSMWELDHEYHKRIFG